MRLSREREAIIRKSVQAMSAFGRDEMAAGELLAELDAVRAELAGVRERFEEYLQGPVLSVNIEGSPEALQLVRLRMSPGLRRLAAHLRRLQGEGRLVDTDGSIVDFHAASELLLGLLDLLLNGGA